jgi:hypothetical protein
MADSSAYEVRTVDRLIAVANHGDDGAEATKRHEQIMDRLAELLAEHGGRHKAKLVLTIDYVADERGLDVAIHSKATLPARPVLKERFFMTRDNEKFREYAFGRAFTLHLSERHLDLLAALCRGDPIASYGLDGISASGLHRRGLVEFECDDAGHRRVRPTRAGVLVYDLLVEAGEHAALEEMRRQTLALEEELHREEWERRFGDVQIKLKDRHLRQPAAARE